MLSVFPISFWHSLCCCLVLYSFPESTPCPHPSPLSPWRWGSAAEGGTHPHYPSLHNTRIAIPLQPQYSSLCHSGMNQGSPCGNPWQHQHHRTMAAKFAPGPSGARQTFTEPTTSKLSIISAHPPQHAGICFQHRLIHTLPAGSQRRPTALHLPLQLSKPNPCLNLFLFF